MSQKRISHGGAVEESAPIDVATRRDAIRGGLLAGGAAIAASSITSVLRAPIALAQTGSDAGIVEALITLEQSAAVTYETVAQGKVLKGELKETARLFGEQMQEHVDLLTAALDDLRGTPGAAPRAEDVEGLSEVSTRKEFLDFAIELENAGVVAYDDAAAKLVGPDLVKTGAEIVCNRAQHLAVLREALGADPIPDAFEAGQSQ